MSSSEIRPAPVASGGQHSSGEVEDFRRMVEAKLAEALRADHQDALFPMDEHQAASYHRTRADLLGWVLDMLPPKDGPLAPVAETAGEIGRNITFSPFDLDTGNAVVSPQEPAGPYWTLIAQGGEADQNRLAAEIVRRLNVPAQDDDKLRRAAEAIKKAKDLDVSLLHDGYDSGAGGGNYVYADVVRTAELFPLLDQALAALKSTAAQEGGSK